MIIILIWREVFFYFNVEKFVFKKCNNVIFNVIGIGFYKFGGWIGNNSNVGGCVYSGCYGISGK